MSSAISAVWRFCLKKYACGEAPTIEAPLSYSLYQSQFWQHLVSRLTGDEKPFQFFSETFFRTGMKNLIRAVSLISPFWLTTQLYKLNDAKERLRVASSHF